MPSANECIDLYNGNCIPLSAIYAIFPMFLISGSIAMSIFFREWEPIGAEAAMLFKVLNVFYISVPPLGLTISTISLTSLFGIPKNLLLISILNCGVELT